jgi:hypothetical protein
MDLYVDTNISKGHIASIFSTHGVTIQKPNIDIFKAVKTSNLAVTSAEFSTGIRLEF